MNNLSWLIYFADVIVSIGRLFSFLTFVCFCVIGVSAIVLFVSLDHDNEVDRRIRALSARILKIFIPVAILMVLLTSLTPSKNTVMMIAASEMGERVLKSQQVQSVIDPSVDLLNAWVRQQTQEIQRQTEQRR